MLIYANIENIMLENLEQEELVISDSKNTPIVGSAAAYNQHCISF